jgi:hypothetical protein
MGQSSSQVEPINSTEQERDYDMQVEKKSKHNRRKEKKEQKRKKALVPNALQEEETAHALLELRGDNINDTRQSSHDDDLAASMQLQAESSPSRHGASYEVGNIAARHSEEIDGAAPALKPRKEKRKRLNLEDASVDEGMSPEVADDRRFKHAKVTQQSAPVLSTQSLDEINSEDEAIASYLIEYENDQIIAPFSPDPEDVESTSQLDKLAAAVARNESPILMQSTCQLPFQGDPSPGGSKEDRQKRNDGYDSNLAGEGTDIHDWPNGTGQHVSDQEENGDHGDHGDHGDKSAKPAENNDQAPNGHLPVDPKSAQNCDDPLPGMEPQMHFDFAEAEAHNRKLSRVYPSRKKRQPIQETPDTDIYALHAISPEINPEEQDQIMPGIEDMPSHLSDTGSLHGDLNGHAASRSSSAVVILPEGTPPPLKKRSKPRGNKTQRGGQRPKNHNPPLKEIAEKGGMFTTIEINKLDAFRNAFCKEQHINIGRFNELIHEPVRGNMEVKELWDGIHELFPYRTRMSVSRFCRRRYHNYSARGIWTPSEDEMLERAVAEKGTSWKIVGTLINRFPEDCRDRYRNYLVNAANRNRDHWTEAEVKNLCWAVYDCMMTKREERRKAKQEEYFGREIPESEPDSDQELAEMKLINWQAVSDRMGTGGGARSRLQCSFKWGKLKNAERDAYMREVREVVRRQKESERRQAQKKTPWRLRKAHKRLRNMKWGDRYDFLQALSTCGATDEGNIPWKILGDQTLRAKWTTTERKAAWEVFKKEVPESDAMDYRDVVNLLLTTLMTEHGDKLDERWDPIADGDINMEIRKRRKEKRVGKRMNGTREPVISDHERYKSNALVKSDDEGRGHEPANGHRNERGEENTEDPHRPNDADVEGAAGAGAGEQSVPGRQPSDGDDESDDSLFGSNGDDSDDEGLFVSD